MRNTGVLEWLNVHRKHLRSLLIIPISSHYPGNCCCEEAWDNILFSLSQEISEAVWTTFPSSQQAFACRDQNSFIFSFIFSPRTWDLAHNNHVDVSNWTVKVKDSCQRRIIRIVWIEKENTFKKTLFVHLGEGRRGVQGWLYVSNKTRLNEISSQLYLSDLLLRVHD